MRLALAGPAGALDTLKAAASECMNLYAEAIENPEDRAKTHAILRKVPGIHQFADTTEVNVRGMWSGGGRLFVVADNTLYEIEIGTYTGGNPSIGAGAVVSSHVLPDASDGQPVILFGNANQLGIVANGFFYWDNGAGPVLARFLLQGTVTAVGAALTWTGGDRFTADMVGRAITLNGEILTVAGYTDATHITASAAPAGGKSGTVNVAPFGIVWYTGGDLFTPDMVGKQIDIGGNVYTVASYAAPGAIQLTDTAAATGIGLAYSTVTTQIEYSCDGGDPVTAVTGAYLAGAAWVQRPAGGTPDLGRQVNFSDPFNFTVWRGLSFKQKEAAPDYIQAIYADRGILLICGTENSEAWQLDTNGLPQRIPGTEIREGLVARRSPAHLAQSLFFLGGSPRGNAIAFRLRGFVPVPVSTAVQEKSWAQNGAYPSEAVCFAYINSSGHQFYVVNFPGAPAWVYDVKASEQLGYPVWHQRAKWNADLEVFTTHRPWFHTFIPEWGEEGMHIVAGPESGKLYELSDEYFDDAGEDIRWRRALPYRYNAGKLIFHGRQDLQAEGNVEVDGGATTGTIVRDFSDDGGETFEYPEQEMGDGKRSRFWPPAGASEARVWRFTGIGQDKVTLIDLQADENYGL